MNKVIVFAGTTEGREICSFLKKYEIASLACTATEYGKCRIEEGGARQIRYRFFCRIDHDAGWICRKRRPQQPKIRFSCFFTCRPDIFRHKIGIRMGCIDNHFRLFFAKKLFHLFFCQSSASNRQGTALLDPAQRERFW